MMFAVKFKKNGIPMIVKNWERMRYVLHKDKAKLTKDELWYLERYTSMFSELKEAYELKTL